MQLGSASGLRVCNIAVVIDSGPPIVPIGKILATILLKDVYTVIVPIHHVLYVNCAECFYHLQFL